MISFDIFNEDHIEKSALLFSKVFSESPWHENWPIASSTNRIQNIYSTPGFRGIVCLSKNEVVGFCLGNIEFWERKKIFYLNEICVDLKVRKTGIGLQLLMKLEQNIRHDDVQEIYLSTVRNVKGPKYFFSNAGFFVNEERIIMSKKL
jgi:aminoglycoside 6'-N-acetyltransferase I